jgi:hypothetical protein
MNTDEFVDIVGFEGLYKVSRNGVVYGLKRGSILKQSINKYGYSNINLTKDGIRYSLLVHRIVYRAFVGELLNDLVIDHIDNNKQNNTIENLRQISSRRNITKGKTNKHGNTGVRFFRQINKYGAEISIERIKYFLGTFGTIEEATNEYKKALNNWVENKIKPYRVKDGYKLCTICNTELPINKFSEVKTKIGNITHSGGCNDCVNRIKREKYSLMKNI